MKSIRSELSSRLSTAASRACSRGRLFDDEMRLESKLCFTGGGGPLTFRRGAGPLSAVGPVDLMKSAKSFIAVSRGTRASLACGPPVRDRESVVLGGALGTKPLFLASGGCEFKPVARLTDMVLRMSIPETDLLRSPFKAVRASSLLLDLGPTTGLALCARFPYMTISGCYGGN